MLFRKSNSKDGSYPEFIIMRLKDTTGVSASVERAKTFTGLQYNVSFTPCDSARYCTELVRDSYLTPDGKPVTERVEGYTAIIFQHECDHLDGILYTDRADSVWTNF